MEGHSEFEVGYRWVSTAGNRDMYRSMINLGDGPKLLRSNFSLKAPYGTGLLFDSFDFSMSNWGGDPYNTMRMNASRMDLYTLRVEYRNLNYYNFIPTYANPLLGAGKYFGQHSLNVTSRTTDIEFKLFPTRKIRPYIGYSRSTGFGPGFTTFSVTGNEFQLNTRWLYASDDYRGGIEWACDRFNLTLEQGYRFLRNDSSVNFAGDSLGNVSRPFLGQDITLSGLNRGYHDRTTMPVSKALMRFTPFQNLTITGRYVYSMADLESTLGEIDTGNLATLDNQLFYRTAADSFNTKAKSPSHSGGFVIEFAPSSRFTFTDQFRDRSYHISGSALLATRYYGARPLSGLPSAAGADATVTDLRASFLGLDETSNQVDLEFDLGGGLAMRAGHRFTFLEASLSDTLNSSKDSSSGDFTTQTGLFGLAYHSGQWLRVGFDYERNKTNHPLTRTQMFNYDQFRINWKLQPTEKWSLTGNIAAQRNSDPQPDIDWKSHNRNFSLALNFEPSQKFFVSLDFSRSTLYSTLAIVLPQTLGLDRSIFDERGHGIGGNIGFDVGRGAKVEFGYRGIYNLGNFPMSFYQGSASLSIPLHNHLAWKTYWQYFGYNERADSLQDYRTHLLTFSLAYTR